MNFPNVGEKKLVLFVVIILLPARSFLWAAGFATTTPSSRREEQK
jgi:hypothetical protein